MLTPLADRWIAVRNTTKPSPNTVAARQRDLTMIADHLADLLERQRPVDKEGEPVAALEVLSIDDLNRPNLEDAFAGYAAGHAPSSTRRVMSTWRQFCLWLIRESHMGANPLDLIDGPRRGTWQPKPLHEAAIPIAVNELDTGFFRVRIDRTTDSERAYLVAMASLGAGPYGSGDVAAEMGKTTTQVGPNRDTLIKRGLCYSPRYGVIAFTVPMFDEFVRRWLA